jgi:precorrin-4/cobalt-precorrin-4 C11-methyltransferase
VEAGDAGDDLVGGQAVTVHFIGAGPGAADLITVRAARIIASAPVCLYAGALVPRELLDTAPPGARLVDTANLDLDRITAELVAAHEAGLDVARLHSGDPSVYSAMAERLSAAAAASLKRELTVPGVGQTVILTRTSARSTPMPPGEDLATLGASRATLVLHLAVQRIAELVPELVPHYGADCPVAVVARASRDDELILRGTLADIAGQVEEAGVKRTAVVIVGSVLAAEAFPDSHLYSTTRLR